MPQKSGFFDTTADDPRQYPAREFAEYFAKFVGNGVFGGGTKLKVSASGSDSNVSIALGYGWINGYMYSVFDSQLVLPIVPAATQDRIDRIILRLNVSLPVRAIKAMVLQGNPAASPTAPAIVRSGDIYDLSLAQVRVKANTTVIAPDQVTDERLNNAVCGVVTALIQQADTTSIFNEFQSWLNTKTAEYQQQWVDFMESVQDEGFATTMYVDSKANQAETNAKNASLPYKKVISGTLDCNAQPSGTWFMEIKNNASITLVNAPSGVSLLGLQQIEGSHSRWVSQVAYAQGGGIYQRYSIDSNNIMSWQPWRRILDESGGLLSGTVRTSHGNPFIYESPLVDGRGWIVHRSSASDSKDTLIFTPETTPKSGQWDFNKALKLHATGELELVGMGYMKIGEEINNLKQSGVDAKAAVVASINAMGGSATTNDTWATLAAKIRQINTGKKFAKGTLTSDGTGKITVTGLSFAPRTVLLSHYYYQASAFYYLIHSAEDTVGNRLWVDFGQSTGSSARGTVNASNYVVPNSNGFVATGARTSESYTWCAWE